MSMERRTHNVPAPPNRRPSVRPLVVAGVLFLVGAAGLVATLPYAVEVLPHAGAPAAVAEFPAPSPAGQVPYEPFDPMLAAIEGLTAPQHHTDAPQAATADDPPAAAAASSGSVRLLAARPAPPPPPPPSASPPPAAAEPETPATAPEPGPVAEAPKVYSFPEYGPVEEGAGAPVEAASQASPTPAATPAGRPQPTVSAEAAKQPSPPARATPTAVPSGAKQAQQAYIERVKAGSAKRDDDHDDRERRGDD